MYTMTDCLRQTEKKERVLGKEGREGRGGGRRDES